MIFAGKKSGAEVPPTATGPGGDPWDQKTLEWLGKTKIIGLRITHVERRFKGGPGAPWGRRNTGNPETVVTGYLPEALQHVHLQIEFEDDMPAYGEGWLEVTADWMERYFGRKSVRRWINEMKAQLAEMLRQR